MSLMLKPDLELKDVQLLTICAALAVSESLRELCAYDAKIKWLNDIYCDNRKVCGILTEGEIDLELNRFRSVIVGIGINTLFDDNLPSHLDTIYTALDGTHDRNTLISCVITKFYHYYKGLPTNKEQLIERYQSLSNVIGKTIRINDEQDDYVVQKISDQGHLVIKDDFGKTITLNSGEISIKVHNEN